MPVLCNSACSVSLGLKQHTGHCIHFSPSWLAISIGLKHVACETLTKVTGVDCWQTASLVLHTDIVIFVNSSNSNDVDAVLIVFVCLTVFHFDL